MVLSPAPRWLAAAMHGNILPPVEAYTHIYLDKDHTILDYLKPIAAMTETQALEYLVIKDLMLKWPEVFENGRNDLYLSIMLEKDLPSNYRGAWTLSQPEG